MPVRKHMLALNAVIQQIWCMYVQEHKEDKKLSTGLSAVLITLQKYTKTRSEGKAAEKGNVL